MEQYADPKGNKGLSQVTTCMEHLANNQLPCIPLFRIWRGGSAGSSSYLCAALHSGIKLSPLKVWWGFICWGKLTVEVRQRARSVIAAFLERAMKQACQSIGQGQGWWMIMLIITSHTEGLLPDWPWNLCHNETPRPSPLLSLSSQLYLLTLWHLLFWPLLSFSSKPPPSPSFIPLPCSRGGAPGGDFVRENSGVDLEGLRPYCTCQQCGFGADDQRLKSFEVASFFNEEGRRRSECWQPVRVLK